MGREGEESGKGGGRRLSGSGLRKGLRVRPRKGERGEREGKMKWGGWSGRRERRDAMKKTRSGETGGVGKKYERESERGR